MQLNHFPDQFKKKDVVQLSEWTNYSVRNAAKVIAISKATKQDVVVSYRRKPSDVVVAYPAVTPAAPLSPTHSRSLLQKITVSEPFIVYIGTLQPRKNLLRLISAYEKMMDGLQAKKTLPRTLKNKLPSLIIAGKVGWLAEPIIRAVSESPYKEHIKITGYVTDREKQALYQHAVCSVLVGLYEGFGIPPLESLQLGTVPVVANTTSLPEVVGNAGIVVDPKSITSIAKGLEEAVMMTAKQRGQWRKKARQQVSKFSWQSSAEKVLQTLLDVVKKR